ncbi:MAG: YkgJ family cysteine cluster protein [Gammaproteobacteria bacterium]
MQCRIGCGACCIAPSISSPLPLHPHGKPSGTRCLHLDAENKCELFGQPQRPAICVRFRAEQDMCGDNREQALLMLSTLETLTR